MKASTNIILATRAMSAKLIKWATIGALHKWVLITITINALAEIWCILAFPVLRAGVRSEADRARLSTSNNTKTWADLIINLHIHGGIRWVSNNQMGDHDRWTTARTILRGLRNYLEELSDY
jgi:hypothetical protein